LNGLKHTLFLCSTALVLWGCPAEVELEDEICGDGIDNDGNGMADCADWACSEAANCASGDDTGEPEDTGQISKDWAAIVINEFMASNQTGLQDESKAFPDWLELYNPTDTTVDLDGWTLTDDLDEPEKHTLSSLEIAAGEFLVLFADGDSDDGDRHLGFSLNTDGEEVGLYAPDGDAIDRLEYGAQATDLSAARIPDGGSVWEITNLPTPGEPNRPSD
jgi:hypothetical protein